MTTGHKKNYSFGSKKNWRRWVWAETARRLKDQKVPLGKAIVLYLGGVTDYDRKEACSRGFNSNNLICVDNRKEIVDALRAEGKLAICGDILDVAIEYKGANAIICDFCGVITPKLVQRCAVAMGMRGGSVFIFNLMKGRDKWSNDQFNQVGSKHRGANLVVLVAQRMAVIGTGQEVAGRYLSEKGDAIFRWLVGEFKSSLQTYKNDHNIMFDSVAVTMPALCDIDASSNVTIKRQVGAVKAVRTMRINGNLATSPQR